MPCMHTQSPVKSVAVPPVLYQRLQVFQSELVVKEFDSIMGELRQLSMMASRFPDFDIQGKEMFLDKVCHLWVC